MFKDQIIELVEENERIRMDKVPEVEKLMAKEVPIIEATMKRIGAEPIVSNVLVNVDAIRKKELEKALEMLGETDQSKIKIIEELTKNVVASIISAPTKKATKASD
jgi:glutamyl-tRNA reductase